MAKCTVHKLCSSLLVNALPDKVQNVMNAIQLKPLVVLSVWLAQLVKALVASTYVRSCAGGLGSIPGADKLESGFPSLLGR